MWININEEGININIDLNEYNHRREWKKNGQWSTLQYRKN
jgi:hypothetical protein